MTTISGQRRPVIPRHVTKGTCALIYYLQSSVQCVNDKSKSISVRNIPKFKDRASWSRDTFQPMRRRSCVYQQTNQNIAPVLKNFQNNGRSRRTELKMSLQYSFRFHI